MKQMVHVISRELVERKLIFAGALMVGMMILAAPLLPTLRGRSPLETITEAALVIALGWAAATAAASGASVFGRELAERRMGFYFSKPISSWSIWGGKFLGAFLLTTLSASLVLLPATMVGGGVLMLGKAGSGWDLTEFLWLFTAALIIAMSIGHVASIALRSRSKWVALDVFGIMAVAFTIWAAVHPLFLGRAKELFHTLIGVFVFVTGAAFLVAGAVGVLLGRVDIRLVHRATSIALISILGATALTFAGYSFWVRSAEPDDLTSVDVKAAAPSKWFVAEGRSKGRGDYVSAFLINRENGDWFRVPAQRYFGTVDFSKDGRAAAWGETINPSSNLVEIHFADLSSGEPVTKRMFASMNPTLSRSAGPFLSNDGSRMALMNDGVLTIYETATRQSLASIKMPPSDGPNYLAFETNDRIRIHLSHETKEKQRTTTMYEFHLASKRLDALGDAKVRFALPNDAGDRVIGLTEERGRLVLDGRNGAVIANIGKVARVRWLSDGRIVVLRFDDTGDLAQLDLLTKDGALIRSIDIGRVAHTILGSEVAPGKVVVVTSLKGPESRDVIAASSVHLIDLDAGTVKKVADGLTFASYWSDGQLFVDASRGLIDFNPLTGERKTLIAR